MFSFLHHREVMELPTYEFECTCCPSKFEMKRGFHDEGPVSCPKCGGKARRCFSSVPIIFKGSGFYVTDSRGGQSYTSSAASGEDKSASDKPASEKPAVAAAETAAPKSESKVAAGKDK
jgi:putative FmdB family regulatory protein